MRNHLLPLICLVASAISLSCCGGSKPPISVTVFDGGLTNVPVNGTVNFTATVINSSNQTVTWAVVGGANNGTINSSTGLYTAPANVPSPATITVTATPQANMSVAGQGSVTVVVIIFVSPPAASLAPLGTQPFSASVQGSTNQAVNWAVNGIAGGNPSVGTISASGVFQAPESVPVSAGRATTVTVSATPQVSSSISASATVTVVPNNQSGQSTPIDLGTSGGNANNVNAVECASGTLGSLVALDGKQYILSNNHVLADSDAGNPGDPIIQPGLVDAPSPCIASSGTTTVANLSQSVNLEQPSGCTTNCTPPVDAAIAQVVSGDVTTTGAILDLTDTATMSSCCAAEAPASMPLPISSITPNSTAVAKSGRSTGLTCSTVESINTNIAVQYTHGLGGPTFTANYINQIVINGGAFSAAGDSGSLIVSQAAAQPVALLYAGNSTSTAGNPILTVLQNFPGSNPAPDLPTFVGPASRGPVAGCTSSGADAFDTTKQKSTGQITVAHPSDEQLSQAEAVKNANAAALMTDPAVLAIGVAPSLDRPRRAAIVLFVRQGRSLRRAIPHNLSGVPTRIITVNSLSRTGILDQDTTASFAKLARLGGPAGPATAHPTTAQLAAATAVKEKYAAALMREPAIFGVGVTASLDNPSEPAILIFVEKGKSHAPIPLELGGYRVQVQETDRFRAFGWGTPRPRRRELRQGTH
jgi:hypothetical protein